MVFEALVLKYVGDITGTTWANIAKCAASIDIAKIAVMTWLVWLCRSYCMAIYYR
jgi:hypothetical protein